MAMSEPSGKGQSKEGTSALENSQYTLYTFEYHVTLSHFDMLLFCLKHPETRPQIRPAGARIGME